jgi:hypothetical protein
MLREKIEAARAKNANAADLEKLLMPFIEGYSVLGLPETCVNVWWRARKDLPPTGRCATLQEVIYRPGGSAIFARASKPKIEVFYAGWNAIVALDEIRAQQGDKVQLTAVRVRHTKEPAVISHPLGYFQSYFVSGQVGRFGLLVPELERLRREDSDLYRRNVFIDATLSEWFREDVAESNPDRYTVTALYAHLLIDRGAILYPSVQNFGGWNLATSASVFDGHFEVLSTEVLEINATYGYGLYDTKRLHYSDSFGADGHIDYDRAPSMPRTWSPQAGTVVPPTHQGWQKKRGA